MGRVYQSEPISSTISMRTSFSVGTASLARTDKRRSRSIPWRIDLHGGKPGPACSPGRSREGRRSPSTSKPKGPKDELQGSSRHDGNDHETNQLGPTRIV